MSLIPGWIEGGQVGAGKGSVEAAMVVQDREDKAWARAVRI